MPFRFFAPLAAVALCASPSVAQPMWDRAEHWTCTLERHLKAVPGQAVTDMNPEGLSFEIDFARGTLTSAFNDDEAEVISRSYYPSEFGAHNVLIADWATGAYPYVILQEADGHWQISGSGAGEGDAWITMYRCLPSG